MDGYLLDTNVLIHPLKPQPQESGTVQQWLAKLSPEMPILVSVAALAELYVGPPRLKGADDVQARREIETSISHSAFKICEITKHTAAVYGDLKARMMRQYNRPKGKGKWPEKWPLPDKGSQLGIDEFDLLIVAHALEYRLVLVTNDDMKRIRDGLGEVAAELQIVDWTKEPPV
ncbi:MAG: type II toxin-antitoxin system VapC family toxin [Phycisphaerales bacterium]|nr:type II toxin-antitoxin system VapC family toxin [Phycisphaerales bacterium]